MNTARSTNRFSAAVGNKRRMRADCSLGFDALMIGIIRGDIGNSECPSTQHPQDSVEHGSRVLPRATATVRAALGPQERFDQFPLGIAEFPSSSHALLLPAFLPAENS